MPSNPAESPAAAPVSRYSITSVMGCNHFVSVFVDLLMLYSRRGAEFAGIIFCFLPAHITFCVLARFIDLYLSQRRQELLYLFCSYPRTPLRTLRLGENYIIFSLAEAPGTQRIPNLVLFKPKNPLRALRLGEIMIIFYSRRGAEGAENCFVCFVLTPNTFARAMLIKHLNGLGHSR